MIFSAGDMVKFGFPMAATITVLAWGMIDYKDAFECAGNAISLVNRVNCIRIRFKIFKRAVLSMPKSTYLLFFRMFLKLKGGPKNDRQPPI